jgi:hypothetical protein
MAKYLNSVDLVAREGVETPDASLFRLALKSICNELTDFGWLHKCFKSH